jgi:transcriptional regulator with XRE-family HTH domain
MSSRILVAVGARVRSARLEVGITQAELAVKAGLHEATLSRLENGILDSVKLLQIEAIARALEVSFEGLVCGKFEKRVRSEAPTVRIRPRLPGKRGGR